MDTTEEYIKMCEKAEEIQKDMHRFLDMFYSVNVPEYDTDGICWFNRDNKKTIWIPRQDQMQKMVFEYLAKGNDTYSFFTLILDFSHFANQPCEFDSIEQLWLAFVMRELYNKVWNGKEWKREEDRK